MDSNIRKFDKNDVLVRRAVEIVIAKGKFSTAMLQTYLGKGHGFVSGLAIWFERIGVIGPAYGNMPRDVLISSMDEFDALASNDDGYVNLDDIRTASGFKDVNQYVPNDLSKALGKRYSDFNFNVWIVASIIFAFPTFGLLLFATHYLVKTKKEINEYYESDDFKKLKKNIQKNAEDVNAFNQHIVELKNAYTGERVVPRGESTLTSGGYNFKRAGWGSLGSAINTHHCSLSVVKNSKEEPFKYICKYFDIPQNEDSLNRFEELYNNFAAAEQGQILLLKERDDIFAKISDRIPKKVINYTPYRLIRELGFNPVDKTAIQYPKYDFLYVSAGGNSIANNEVLMNLQNIEKFNMYLAASIKWRKSIAGQRALMTSRLREEIKERDHYACRKCGASVKKEPNLLLEIDHIVPLAKGGETTVDNLQTLCWRCNRSKGAKLE